MLVEEHGLTPAQVEPAESWTHPRRPAHTDRPEPTTELEAKFSVQYCLARALMSRAVKLEHSATRAFTSRKSVTAAERAVDAVSRATRDTADPIGDQLEPRLSQRSQRYLQCCHAPVVYRRTAMRSARVHVGWFATRQTRIQPRVPLHAQIQSIARGNRVNAFVDSLRSASVTTNCRIVSTDGAKLLL